MHDEPRRDPSPRIPFDADVEVTEPQSRQVLRGRSLDLGLGGLFVSTSQPLPARSLVQVQFSLPCGEPVSSMARVIRAAQRPAEPSGMALRFEGLPARPGEGIKRLMDGDTGLRAGPAKVSPDAVDEDSDPCYGEAFTRFCNSVNDK